MIYFYIWLPGSVTHPPSLELYVLISPHFQNQTPVLSSQGHTQSRGTRAYTIQLAVAITALLLYIYAISRSYYPPLPTEACILYF